MHTNREQQAGAGLSWSWRVSRLARRVLRWGWQARAVLTGRRFVCRALSGESNYNVSIQCDMTVTCNCQDEDGSGVIGDLHAASFEHVWADAPARRLRATLARGRLPLLTCARCAELQLASPETAVHRVDHFDLPRGGVLLENTVACNLHCPGCMRERVCRARLRMPLEDVRAAAETLARMRVRVIHYFNRGEPFLSPDIGPELRLLRACCPEAEIHVSTNGHFLHTPEQREAALCCDRIEVSLDGCDQRTMQRYQRGGDFERALSGLRDLVAARDAQGARRPVLEWKYLLFRWNDRRAHIERALEQAREIGVDVISFWPTRNPLYGISWRYRLHGFCRRVGAPSWKGREVILREEGEGEGDQWGK